MFASLITLVFAAGLFYCIFLAPTPDEETLREENIDIEEYERGYVRDIIFCIIGIILTQIINIIVSL